MIIADITSVIESFAHPALQEDYDNAGLLTGDASWQCTGVLCTLDVTEGVIIEAIDKGLNLIVAHHPIIFKGLKRLAGKSFVERIVVMAIKNDIAIYAAHTNLDNIAGGVNARIAAMLGLKDLSILEPKAGLLRRLSVYIPSENVDTVKEALFHAGAGQIGNYSECSFHSEGTGTFKPEEGSEPHTGQKGERFSGPEMKLEVVFPAYHQAAVITALRDSHPYEEVAYGIYQMQNDYQGIGAGIVGTLEEAMEETGFLHGLRKTFSATGLRHTPLLGKKVGRVAVCGGAGSFLIKSAVKARADVFITSDIKYHEFFEADGQIVVVDIGHYESEQFTSDLLRELLLKKFPTFAVLKSGVDTNPVHYLL